SSLRSLASFRLRSLSVRGLATVSRAGAAAALSVLWAALSCALAGLRQPHITRDKQEIKRRGDRIRLPTPETQINLSFINSMPLPDPRQACRFLTLWWGWNAAGHLRTGNRPLVWAAAGTSGRFQPGQWRTPRAAGPE